MENQTNQLPIIEINDDNFRQLWPILRDAIKEASFIAVDCEYSGLGDRKKINYSEIDIRYQYTAESARNYSVLSMGLSCFTLTTATETSMKLEDKEGEEQEACTHDYLVQTFNILTICSEDVKVDCRSMKFLSRHGFDFNKLFSKGLHYYKGCDREESKGLNVRQVFGKIIELRKPLVLHNGFLDLIFLYQAFYSELPKKIDTFSADLKDMFPNGIYDTKYITEFHQSLPATYLDFVYNKMILNNVQRSKSQKSYVHVKFPPHPSNVNYLQWFPYLEVLSKDATVDDDDKAICENFAYHGWCDRNYECGKSHNINKIVQLLLDKGTKVCTPPKTKHSKSKPDSLVKIIQGVALKEDEDRTKKSMSQDNQEAHRKRKRRDHKKTDGALRTNDKEYENDHIRDEARCQDSTEDDSAESNKGTISKDDSGGSHNAGYDAFMTGFVFSTYVAKKDKLVSEDSSCPSKYLETLKDEFNKIYLIGKTFPFLIRTGTYAKTSHNHKIKILSIRKES